MNKKPFTLFKCKSDNSIRKQFLLKTANVPTAWNTQWSIVVISQTHWLVSQERLPLRAGTSVFIDLSSDIW